MNQQLNTNGANHEVNHLLKPDLNVNNSNASTNGTTMSMLDMKNASNINIDTKNTSHERQNIVSPISGLSKEALYTHFGLGVAELWLPKVCTGRDSNPGRLESSD